jgi:hypothetical protein
MRVFKIIVAGACAMAGVCAWAGPLNDTGIVVCRDHATGTDTPITATTTCSPMPTNGGQDAQYGRDAAAAFGALTKIGAGPKGFDFSKIANDGTVVAATTALGTNPTDWACTYDNNTGLMWEVKTTDGGLRDMNWNYTWYDSLAPSSPSDYRGTPANSGSGAQCTGGVLSCDTEQFVAAVNVLGICNHKDWRLPTARELQNIVDHGIPAVPPNASIDPGYFPNTSFDLYWTGMPYPSAPGAALIVNFGGGGYINYTDSYLPYRIRLVRNGK